MQEPGGAAEVEACVRAKYHVDFHVFEKVKVRTLMFSRAYTPSTVRIARRLTGWAWCGDNEAVKAEAAKRQVRC